jgi:membrane protein DedA with SNARE-associated domain
MLEAFLTWIEAIVLPYGAWGIFAASIIEEVIVPIPSTLVQMGGGFLLMGGLPVNAENLGRLFLLVVMPATLGLTIGSLPAFLVGKYVGRGFFVRFGRYLGVSWEEIEVVSEKMKAKGNIFRVLVFVRSIPVMPAAVASAVAGLLQAGFWSYVLATILGTLIRASVLGFIGWELGAGYKALAPYIERFEKIGLALLLVGVVYWWFWKKKKSKTTGPATLQG